MRYVALMKKTQKTEIFDTRARKFGARKANHMSTFSAEFYLNRMIEMWLKLTKMSLQ